MRFLLLTVVEMNMNIFHFLSLIFKSIYLNHEPCQVERIWLLYPHSLINEMSS